jgi:uncharacterized protein (DUF488 family)
MLTIGHSTLPIEVFLDALKQNGCSTLVDVRSIPRSRRNPQYEQTALFAELGRVGIRTVWRKGLGGLRHPLPREKSVNNGWRNESFRGYADYMQMEAFAAEMEWLMGLPDFGDVAVMCAEAVPWRCHRSLIADAVLARGGAVEDIFVTPGGKVERRPHAMTRFARVEGTRVWYPAETGELFEPQ